MKFTRSVRLHHLNPVTFAAMEAADKALQEAHLGEMVVTEIPTLSADILDSVLGPPNDSMAFNIRSDWPAPRLGALHVLRRRFASWHGGIVQVHVEPDHFRVEIDLTQGDTTP